MILPAQTATDIRALSFAVALLSGAALAYEILLMRLFSIIQWHHFAYMIISLALLGYGASGVFMAMLRGWLNDRFECMFPLAVILFGLASPGSFWLAQRIPFNPSEIFWAPQQLAYLGLLYLLLAIPFFFAATAIGLALYRYREQASGIYAADLAGAGTGCLAIIGMLFWMPPERALIVLAVIALAGLMPFCLSASGRTRLGFAVCFGIAAALLSIPGSWQVLHISPYKELQQFLRIPGTRIVDRFSSPIGDVHIAESARTPLRHAPGLSLNADVELPRQLAVFTDAGNMAALTHYDGRPETLAFLDQTTSALPFHLQRLDNVLILGAGTGTDVLQARYFGIHSIDAVELNGQLLRYLREQQDEFGGRIFSRRDIRWHTGEARGFVSSSASEFGLIEISLLDAFGASSAGLYALSENYLYTVEALQEYLEHLKPQGYLAITRWIKMPPRDALKLFATAVRAMENAGRADPKRQLLMIRGWQTSTLLIKNGDVTPEEIASMKKFCEERSFDIDYYPGVSEAEANLYNIMAEPYYYRAAQALLNPEEHVAYIDGYKFDIRPATDDQPYFFKFFKWATLPEIVSLYGQGGISLLESGYIILVAGALQALLAGALFIGLPLALWKNKLGFDPHSSAPWRMLAFFFCLGLAFLFIEIAFIQKFILFLHHPVYSVSVVLSAFLISAGIGSHASRVLAHKRHGHWYPVIGIAATAFVYLIVLKDLTALLLHQPPWINILVSILLTTPLGFFMGMPFPIGLIRAGQLDPALIPWAWGINGFASVISAMLATLIAIHWGFNAVIVTAAGLYMLAGVCLPSNDRQDQA
ncbi:MAG: SAM-dependent methyltransferase [Gammaproteobacteria bacterium]